MAAAAKKQTNKKQSINLDYQLSQQQIMTGDIIATVKKSPELFGVG